MGDEVWGPQGRRYRKAERAAVVIRWSDDNAACTEEVDLFDAVVFQSNSASGDDKRRAANICAACPIKTQCPMRLYIPKQVARRGRPKKVKEADPVAS